MWASVCVVSVCVSEVCSSLRVRVRVRVSKDLIFDCENANTPLHGKSIDPRFYG